MISDFLEKEGKALAQIGLDQIVKRASDIYDILIGDYKDLDIEMVVKCPESIQEYSIAFEAKGGYLPKKIRFPYGRPIRAKLRPSRTFTDLSDAITLLDNGFELNTQKMKDYDTFFLKLEYKISDPNFIDSFVDKRSAREVPKGRDSEYWMHAALKHPNVLKTKYGKVDLLDVDFSVNVGIGEEINVVPSTFKNELKTAYNWMTEPDPHKKAQLSYEHAREMKGRGKDVDIIDAISHVQDLFLPPSFCTYVDVQKEFRYNSCERGTDYFDSVPLMSIPRTMRVTSRTDLTLKNFAADGVLVYRKHDLQDEISKILGVN